MRTTAGLKTAQKLTLIGLLALLTAAVVGLVVTGRPSDNSLQTASRQTEFVDRQQVNLQFLETARRLAALAATSEEQQLAQNVVRIADQAVDLAFAAALRATADQYTQTPEVLAIERRISQTQAAIQASQGKVRQLSAAFTSAGGAKQETLRQQIEVAQAEIALYQDALGDAKEDLIRAGGDAHSQIQHLLDEHEAAAHSTASAPTGANSQPAPALSSGSLIGRWQSWSAVRQKRSELLLEQQDALRAADALSHQHDELAQRVEKVGQVASPPELSTDIIAQPVPAGGVTASKQAAGAFLTSLHHLSDDQKNLANLDKQVQYLQELGSVYGQWVLLVKAVERLALHNVIESALWIVLTLLVVFLTNRLIGQFFARLTLERKQRAALRAVARLSVQAVALLVILLVVFGKPSQLSTILGLAGAGLTLVLKDFIVSFLGWFVLMGRNGIRVGDTVEINGVRGEVIEIGLLRTILLETGNWTDAGQPTGRQVSFLNSFAIQGHYFNFSTSGQWLWDELKVLIPASQNPYHHIEKIRDIVAKETEGTTRLAEQEWEGLTRRYGLRSFSAEPTVNVKPTDLGVHVVVRYVTRANERSEVRYRLSHAIVRLLQDVKDLTAAAAMEPAPSKI
jgi:small-conductance mechanosensitive channel